MYIADIMLLLSEMCYGYIGCLLDGEYFHPVNQNRCFGYKK